MKDIDNPYKPPSVQPSLPFPAPLKTDRTLQKWLTFLIAYPAIDIGIPFFGSLLMGRQITSISTLLWPAIFALLIAAVILVWRARSKVLLFAFPPIIIGFAFTSAMTRVSLVAALTLLIVLFLRLPKSEMAPNN